MSIYPIDQINPLLQKLLELATFEGEIQLTDAQGKLFSLKLLPENINPPVDKLIYEDEIQPITNTDTFDDHSYMEQIDATNQGTDIPQSTVENDAIQMLLHSFNTFELGVKVDDSGNIVLDQEWSKPRIDSVNGLIKIDELLGKPIQQNADYYIEKIGELSKNGNESM